METLTIVIIVSASAFVGILLAYLSNKYPGVREFISPKPQPTDILTYAEARYHRSREERRKKHEELHRIGVLVDGVCGPSLEFIKDLEIAQRMTVEERANVKNLSKKHIKDIAERCVAVKILGSEKITNTDVQAFIDSYQNYVGSFPDDTK